MLSSRLGVGRWALGVCRLKCSPPRSTRSEVIGALSAGLLVVAFCLLLLWHNPLLFWNDDYELSVLPVFADMARSWSDGHWPILSPTPGFAAISPENFSTGTFSVFVNAAVILIWKFPLNFPQQAAALSMAHLVVLAIGAFLLGRDRGFSIALAMFVALVTSLGGWIICWGATDWFGALGASPGCHGHGGEENALWIRDERNGASSGPRHLFTPCYGRISLYGFDAAASHCVAVDQIAHPNSQCFSIMPLLLGVAVGFGLSAPAWLALLDLVQGSARELQSSAAHWQWRVPPPPALPV